MVRRGKGVRISGGLAHSYYVGVQTGAIADGNGDGMAALCVLPAGVEEGQTVDLTERPFDLLIRQPAEFPLYYSATRTTDRPGQLLPIDPEQLTPLPPIRTVLQSGRKSGADVVSVHLHARLTEIGTLEMWCGEVRGDRQWRLQFDVRSATRADASRHAGTAEAEGFVEERTVAECRNLIRAAFRKPPGGAGDPPAGVVRRLEQATGMGRLEWPSSLMRAFWETLMEVESGRRIGVEHEAPLAQPHRILSPPRLRPGGGRLEGQPTLAALPGRRAVPEERAVPRRVVDPLAARGGRTVRRAAGDARRPARRRLAHVDSQIRQRRPRPFAQFPVRPPRIRRSLAAARVIGTAQARLKSGARPDAAGAPRAGEGRGGAGCDPLRAGTRRARVPVYGPFNTLVDAQTAEEWVRSLLEANPGDERAMFAAVQLTRKTGDRYRDVSDDVRQSVLAWLERRGAAGHLRELVREGGQLREEEQRSVFGESLPRGLRIE